MNANVLWIHGAFDRLFVITRIRWWIVQRDHPWRGQQAWQLDDVLDYDFECNSSSFSDFLSDFSVILRSGVPSTIAWPKALPTHIVLYVWVVYIDVLRRIGCCLCVYLGSQNAFVRSGVTRPDKYPMRPRAAGLTGSSIISSWSTTYPTDPSRLLFESQKFDNIASLMSIISFIHLNGCLY